MIYSKAGAKLLKSVGSDMSGSNASARALFDKLRRLAAERPSDARAEVARLLDDRPIEFQGVLLLISAPGEGRLRHIVTNSVIESPERMHSVPLLKWYSTETDEFTKNALRRALDICKISAVEPVTASKYELSIVDEQFFEAYKYVADRLEHRIRNALLGLDTAILELKESSLKSADGFRLVDIVKLVNQLEDEFRYVGRIVDFDTEEEHFQMRSIPIHDWLLSMNAAYAQKYRAIGLHINASDACKKVEVTASQHLMEEIFRNLWINAQQEVGQNCKITINMDIVDQSVKLVILDNGDGFSTHARDAAFQQAYSGAKHRRGRSGRGLLEVNDAVVRLHGTAGFVEVDGRYRVMIELPREVS